MRYKYICMLFEITYLSTCFQQASRVRPKTRPDRTLAWPGRKLKYESAQQLPAGPEIGLKCGPFCDIRNEKFPVASEIDWQQNPPKLNKLKWSLELNS